MTSYANKQTARGLVLGLAVLASLSASSSAGQKSTEGQKSLPGASVGKGTPIDAPYQNDSDDRQAANYLKAISQFAVEKNPRYKGERTYCNIFAWDVTRAMHAEIPHWYDPQSGKAASVGHGHKEMTASLMLEWLRSHGRENQWKKVDAQAAQDWANAGKPAVVVGDGGKNMGHVAVVRPGALTAKGPSTAQAGAHNFENGHVYEGFFGTKGEKGNVEFWIHP